MPHTSDALRALEQQVHDLQSLLRDRDDVLALAAHELRNPLHELSLRLSLVRAVSQPYPDIARHVAKAQTALANYTERATVLLELVARPGHHYVLNRKPVDLADTLAALVERVSAEAQARGIVLKSFLPATCPVDTDAMVVCQIVDNLLLNAFKHAGGHEVVLSLAAQQGQVHIRVCDDGRGIAPEDQERIFHKFGTVGGTAKQVGTGLGLWIVRRLAAALDGQISLHSEPGAGACFDLCFPLSNESPDAATNPSVP